MITSYVLCAMVYLSLTLAMAVLLLFKKKGRIGMWVTFIFVIALLTLVFIMANRL